MSQAPSAARSFRSRSRSRRERIAPRSLRHCESAGWPAAGDRERARRVRRRAVPGCPCRVHARRSPRARLFSISCSSRRCTSACGISAAAVRLHQSLFPDVTQNRYGTRVRSREHSLVRRLADHCVPGFPVDGQLYRQATGGESGRPSLGTSSLVHVSHALHCGRGAGRRWHHAALQPARRRAHGSLRTQGLVVGGIAASALFYYLRDLRHEEKEDA